MDSLATGVFLDSRTQMAKSHFELTIVLKLETQEHSFLGQIELFLGLIFPFIQKIQVYICIFITSFTLTID